MDQVLLIIYYHQHKEENEQDGATYLGEFFQGIFSKEITDECGDHKYRTNFYTNRNGSVSYKQHLKTADNKHMDQIYLVGDIGYPV